MSALNMPCRGCGTSRWHAKGCPEVPEEFRDCYYDEAHRIPSLGDSLVHEMERAQRLLGKPPLTPEVRELLRSPANMPGEVQK